MESKWYLFSGQTLENTKISDRAHALHITKSAWNDITRHLDRKKLLQEAADKEAAIKRYLDEGSKNMTKEWENSLENVRRRKEEERLRLIEEKKEERQQRFLALRKEQEEIRTKYMDKVKKQIYMTTGHARDLTSALVLSEVLYEREKQQEFMEKIKKHEKEEDQIYLEYGRKKTEEENKNEAEKKRKEIEKQKAYAGELIKTVEEKALSEKTLKEDRVKKEALDNIEAVKEMEKLDQLVIEDKLRKKKELFELRKNFLQQRKEVESQRAKEDKELDEVLQIYQDAKHRMECMKKEREKEMREETVKRREKIANMVMAEQLDKSAAEEERIRKAIEERDAAEMEKIKAKKEHEQKMIQDRLKYREEIIAQEAKKKKSEDEFRKWELLNRLKADECMKTYEENQKKALWQEILDYRKDLCEEMEDVRAEQLREKQIEVAFQEGTLKDEDSKFFEYADEVLQLAKKKGRNTYPIENVIAKYVKEMNIDSETSPTDSRDVKTKLLKQRKPKLCRCRCANN